MFRRALLAISSIVVVAALSPAVAQTPGAGRDRRTATVEGRVTDVFGNKFVVEGDSDRVLVETGPEWHHRVELRPGERVKVVGRRDDGGFEAFRIIHEDGREVTIRSSEGPPPWAGGPNKDRSRR